MSQSGSFCKHSGHFLKLRFSFVKPSAFPRYAVKYIATKPPRRHHWTRIILFLYSIRKRFLELYPCPCLQVRNQTNRSVFTVVHLLRLATPEAEIPIDRGDICIDSLRLSLLSTSTSRTHDIIVRKSLASVDRQPSVSHPTLWRIVKVRPLKVLPPTN